MVLAIDIGGTNSKFAIIDSNNKMHKKWVIPSRKYKNYQMFIKTIVEEYRKNIKDYDITGISFSSFGVVHKDGTVTGSGSLGYLIDTNFSKEIASILKIRVIIENDGNCSLVSELWKSDKKTSMVSIVMGTGIGGSVMIDGKIWHGAFNGAGEIGWLINIDKEGKEEIKSYSAIASTITIVRRINKALKTNYSGEEIYELYEKNENKYIRLEMSNWFKNISKIILNTQYIINPEKVVLSGGVTNNKNFLANIKKEYSKLISNRIHYIPQGEIVLATFLSDSNLHGAAYLFFKDNIK